MIKEFKQPKQRKIEYMKNNSGSDALFLTI